MHRSGTSALAGTLGLLGAALPNNMLGATGSNPKGHFEFAAVLGINKQILSALNTCWYDFCNIELGSLDSGFITRLHEAIQCDYSETSLFVIKDPRICRLLPLFISTIEALGASPCVVFCLRNPLEVAHSLNRRNGISLSHAYCLWLRYMLEAELHSRDLRRVFIDFSEFLQDWRSAISRIEQQLGIVLPGSRTYTANAVDEFLDTTLRHSSAGCRGLQAGPEERSWVSTCYEAFNKLVLFPYDKDAIQRLDRIRSEFEEPANFFGGVVKEYYSQLEETRPRLKAAEKKAEIQKKKMQQKQQEIDKLKNEIRHLHSSISWRLTAPLRKFTYIVRKARWLRER